MGSHAAVIDRRRHRSSREKTVYRHHPFQLQCLRTPHWNRMIAQTLRTNVDAPYSSWFHHSHSLAEPILFSMHFSFFFSCLLVDSQHLVD